MSIRRHAALVLTIAGATILTAGCSATGIKAAARPPEISPLQPERAQEALHEYDARRDAVQYQAALAFFRQGNAAECREALEQILSRTPDAVEPRLLLSELDLYEQQPAEAAAQLDQLPTALAADPRVLYLRGQCHEASQRPDLAVECWSAAADRDPNNPLYRSQLNELRSRIAASTGADGNEATGSTGGAGGSVAAGYSVGAGEISTPAEAVRAVAAALRGGNPLRAAEIAEKAVARFPRSAEVWRAAGLARHSSGHDESAEVALRQALSLDNAHPLTYFFLGATLERRGQHAEAAECFRQAAVLDPRYQRVR